MRQEDSDTLNYFMSVQESNSGYLPMEEPKEGWSYRIPARNAHIGIWIPERKGFIISRTKFERNYLFVEYHWDSGIIEYFEVNGETRKMNFGTVKPFFEIEQTSFKSEELSEDYDKPKYNEILNYLNRLSERYHY